MSDLPRTRSRLDLLLGVLGGAMVLLAIAALVRGGPEDGVAGPAAPELVLVSPAQGAVAARPLTVRFSSPVELRPAPSGWGTGALHIHLRLDGRDYMPARDDIRPEGDRTYLWTVGPVPPGPHSLRLFWSDSTHSPIAGGGSRPVRIEVR